jgi:ribosome-associated protein
MAAPLRKAPLAGPKRPGGKRAAPAEGAPQEPSSKSRELAIALAAAGIDKKALGIEVLDVTGKVDYADFLVIMTGRSDRHVHAIATGLEEAMRQRKAAPLSMEGLGGATWVLIDFGDVVVHVFQEEARALYDIEGLWIDASRIPVPADGPPPPLDLR